MKRNRFVKLTGATKSVNRDLETKTRALAGLKGYVTNLPAPTPEFVMGAYHQLWQVEHSFPDVEDRPAGPADLPPQTRLHRAHLSIVMAALAVGRIVEQASDWSISRFVQTQRPCRTITIKAGDQTITAADPIPVNAIDALVRLRAATAH